MVTVKITKISDNLVNIQDFNKGVFTGRDYFALFFAFEGTGGLVNFQGDRIGYPTFSRHFSNYEVNGETFNSAQELLLALSAFVGNFRKGGSSPLPTNLVNSVNGESGDVELTGGNIKQGVEDGSLTINEALQRIEDIATGARVAIVFDTEQQMRDWLAGNYTRPDELTPADLKLGEDMFIRDVDAPVFWWDGAQPLEQKIKVDLSDYFTKQQVIDRFVKKITPDGEAKVILDNKQVSPSEPMLSTIFSSEIGEIINVQNPLLFYKLGLFDSLRVGMMMLINKDTDNVYEGVIDNIEDGVATGYVGVFDITITKAGNPDEDDEVRIGYGRVGGGTVFDFSILDTSQIFIQNKTLSSAHKIDESEIDPEAKLDMLLFSEELGAVIRTGFVKSNLHDIEDNIAKVAGETIYPNKLCMVGMDGRYYQITQGDTTYPAGTLIASERSFNIFDRMIIYTGDTPVLKNQPISENTYVRYLSSEELLKPNGTMVRNINGLGGIPAPARIWLKGTIQSDGGFKLVQDGSYMVDRIHGTADGFVYLEVCRIGSSNNVSFLWEKRDPVFVSVDKGLVLYTGKSIDNVAITDIEDVPGRPVGVYEVQPFQFYMEGIDGQLYGVAKNPSPWGSPIPTEVEFRLFGRGWINGLDRVLLHYEAPIEGQFVRFLAEGSTSDAAIGMNFPAYASGGSRCYLVGTITPSGGFKLLQAPGAWGTTTEPTTEDGLIYIEMFRRSTDWMKTTWERGVPMRFVNGKGFVPYAAAVTSPDVSVIRVVSASAFNPATAADNILYILTND